MAFPAHLFWKSPTGHPALNQEMVSVAQTRLGVELPPEYLTLLYLQNGGCTHEFGFGRESAPPIPVREIFGIVVDPVIDSTQTILNSPYLTQKFGLPQGLVVLAGKAPEWLALDYRQGYPPGVTWIDLERALEVPLAPTFADFVAGLRPLEELTPN